MKFLLTLIISVCLLTGCGQSTISPMHQAQLAGHYTSVDGRDQITFTADGKVQVNYFNQAKETSYVVDKKNITFQFHGGLLRRFVIQDDGSLVSNFNTKYLKDR